MEQQDVRQQFPGLTQDCADFITALRASGDAPSWQAPTAQIARDRVAARRGRLMGDPVPMKQIINTSAGNVPVRFYRPEGDVQGLIIWIHGGGWVLDDLDGTDAEASRVALEAGAALVSIGYRLAPEHKFPAGLTDCIDAVPLCLAEARRLGLPDGPIAIGGVSSGANLAAVVARALRGVPDAVPIALQVLVVGAFDARATSASWQRLGEGLLLDRPTMEWFVGHYLDDPSQAADPRVSPLLAEDLTGLPPALVITAEFDPLHDEGVQYAERLAQAGVPVEHLEIAGVIHGFLGQLGPIAPSEDAFRAIGAAARAALRS
jgi:acetyl esterase